MQCGAGRSFKACCGAGNRQINARHGSPAFPSGFTENKSWVNLCRTRTHAKRGETNAGWYRRFFGRLFDRFAQPKTLRPATPGIYPRNEAKASCLRSPFGVLPREIDLREMCDKGKSRVMITGPVLACLSMNCAAYLFNAVQNILSRSWIPLRVTELI